MNNGFNIIKPQELQENTFKLIGTDWMLITAGTAESFNTMTASWGGMGILWGKEICFCVVRPQRYTYEFMERNSQFTLSFFDKKYRKALNFCGKKSGRDVDKIASTGLTPISDKTGIVYFNEARIVLECRKIYFQDLNPENFIDPGIDKNYSSKDYHRMYVGEIARCLVK
jgi:flavin reductase (DIM6/NTAB) family NADH-FMN oxidoreductase RutF